MEEGTCQVGDWHFRASFFESKFNVDYFKIVFLFFFLFLASYVDYVSVSENDRMKWVVPGAYGCTNYQLQFSSAPITNIFSLFKKPFRVFAVIYLLLYCFFFCRALFN